MLWTNMNDKEINLSLKLKNVICGPSDRQYLIFNLLMPNANYNGRTAPLTSKVAFYTFIQQI